MPQDELFESPPTPTESDSKADMIALTIADKPPKKQRKPRAPMTPARKALLLENLKRGRETSAKNRKLKAEARRIVKEKKMDEVNEVIRNDVMLKQTKGDLEAEISRLKAKISNTKAPSEVAPAEQPSHSAIEEASAEPAIVTFSTHPKSIWTL